MQTAAFKLYTGRSRSAEHSLELTPKIHRLLEQLCRELQLPTHDHRGQSLVYTLYNHTQGRGLSRERSLAEEGCEPGDELYLGLRDNPWWELHEAPDGRPPRGAPLNRELLAFIAMAAALALVLAGFYLGRSTGDSTEIKLQTLGPAAAGPGIEGPATPSTTPAPRKPGPLATPTLALPSPTLATPPTSPPAAPQEPLREATIRGVSPAYQSIDASYFFSSGSIFGAHLWAERTLSTTIPATVGRLLLSNGDQVAILDDSAEGVYLVRVLSNRLDPQDPKVKGAEGWVARWVVDGEGIPPTPTQDPSLARTPTRVPARSRFRPRVEQSYPSSGDSGLKSSCVQGRVVDRSGRGIGGAVLYANNYYSNTPTFVTNANGEFNFCSLGYSQWTLVLTFVPRSNASGQDALPGEVKQTFFVNGSAGQVVKISFFEPS